MVRIGDWDFPEDLLYDRHNQWIANLDNKIRFGLTPYGLAITGDVLYLALPEAGAAVEKGSGCGSLEAGKWVGRIYAPVSGRIVQVNDEVVKQPGSIGKSPYSNWFAEIEPSESLDMTELMTINQLSDWLTEELKQDA